MKTKFEDILKQPYRTVTYFVPEDNTWLAFHPELGEASCYAIGETEDEARRLLVDETRDFISFLLAEGKEIPAPLTSSQIEDLPSGQFITRIPRTLHKKLKEKAEIENVSLNHLVSTLLSESLIKKEYSNIFKELSNLPSVNKDVFKSFDSIMSTLNSKLNVQLENQKDNPLIRDLFFTLINTHGDADGWFRKKEASFNH